MFGRRVRKGRTNFLLEARSPSLSRCRCFSNLLCRAKRVFRLRRALQRHASYWRAKVAVAPVLFKGLLHVSFNRSRLKDKNMQQFKVAQEEQSNALRRRTSPFMRQRILSDGLRVADREKS